MRDSRLWTRGGVGGHWFEALRFYQNWQPSQPMSSAVDGPGEQQPAEQPQAAGRGAETLPAQLRALLRAFQRGTALVESLGTCLTAEQRWGAPSAEQLPAGRCRKLRRALQAARRLGIKFQAPYCICNIKHSIHARPRAKTSHLTESVFRALHPGPSECSPPRPEPYHPVRVRARYE
eukprot:CAMPEP_0182611242 /NCGR_PEP_ID=MMETSP1330-20130603/13172_1 /TAXON_ID=464278 /ORGANISM="Picochlorum sp., Strain RCC944" /LENGTH=176 /DNA_ID=CAMNT_0024830625 /DNA_START=436 /DNA_END=967 /DNA_ORIENTATION=-